MDASQAAALSELEQTLLRRVKPAFLAPQHEFRPLTHVIEVLSSEIVEEGDLSRKADETTSVSWLVVRTLAGKALPLPTITPDDTIGDVLQRLEEDYGVMRAQGGLLYLNERPLDESTFARELRTLPGLPQPPSAAALTICNAAYVALQQQLQVVDDVVDQFLSQHYSTLSSSVRGPVECGGLML